jgi:hypothetical protein
MDPTTHDLFTELADRSIDERIGISLDRLQDHEIVH